MFLERDGPMRGISSVSRSGLAGASCALCFILIVDWTVGKGSAIPTMTPTALHMPAVVSPLAPIEDPNVAVGRETQVEVFQASSPRTIAPPGSEISIQTNFNAQKALPHDDSVALFLVDAQGFEVSHAENDLNNLFTVMPTSQWAGPITLLTSIAVPRAAHGEYSILLALDGPAGPEQLISGLGVIQYPHFRYKIGTLRVSPSAPPPPPLPAKTLDLTGYHLTLNEAFAQMSISDSRTNDGSRWYARNKECCMATTDGTSTAMVGVSSPQNPFSLIPGGGLNIRLQRTANSWTSGVITSVDSVGEGFSQQYGYFEMKAKFPSGEDTWPAFWLLNTASKRGAPEGEIDIVEYIANPHFANYIATTLHDWSKKTAPAASHYQVQLPTDGFHTYGMMWTSTTMTFYFDSAVTMRCPTPAMMKQPYYLLVDLGIGSGWPTENTPPKNDMQIQYIRVYAKQAAIRDRADDSERQQSR
jgi:hypothetical protein